MLKNNWTKIVGALVWLILLMIVGQKMGWWSKKDDGKSFFGDKIESFCIDDCCLKRDSDRWWVTETDEREPADEEIVKNYLNRLLEIKLEMVASDNQKRFGDLGIGEEEKVVLKIEDQELELGNVAGDGSGTYVREKNGEKVYKLEVVLDGSRLKSRDFWQVKYLTNLPRMQVEKVETEDGEISDDKIINLICSLPVEKFLSEQVDDEGKRMVIKIKTEGEEKELKLGMVGGKSIYYWASVDEGVYYQISRDNFYLLTGMRG